MNDNTKYIALARRELWEHRGLWAVPLAAAALAIFGVTFGGLDFSSTGFHLTLNSPLPSNAGPQVGSILLLGTAAMIGLFTSIVICVYLLDCLFAERKDRSILFWKSLPVSDAETVLTKLVVALVLVPLFVLLLTLVLQPLLAGIVALRFPLTRPVVWPLLGGGFSAVPNLVGIGFIGLLWYAPLATYMMVASLLAKRTPIVYVLLPPLALGGAERVIFGTMHVFQFVGERLAPFPSGTSLVSKASDGTVSLAGDWWKAFADPALWLGLLAAAAMIYVAVRLRRYRDDT